MSKQFRILAPCPKDYDSLGGAGALRYCAECDKPVHDFSKLRRSEIERLTNKGEVCAIIERDGQGAMQTADPLGWRCLLRRQFLRWAAGFGVLSLRLATAQSNDAATGGIRGLVVDSSGAPMAGVRVSSHGSRTALSRDLGKFELLGLSPGKHSVEFSTAGFASKTVEVVAAGGIVVNVGRIEMSLGRMIGDAVEISKPEPEPVARALPLGSVSGTVTAKNGVWLAARLQLHRTRGGPSILAQAGTNGRFLIENVLPGDYEMEVAMPRYGAYNAPVTVGPSRLDITPIVLDVE